MYFFFDEAVKVSSFTASEITFLNASDATSGVTLLSATASVGRDYTEVIVNLSIGCPSADDAKGGCDWNRLRTAMDIESAVYLSLTSAAFTDNALPPNSITAIGNTGRRRRGRQLSDSSESLSEAEPYCGPCESGSYEETPCTTVYDQVCSNCTGCGDNFYQSGDCSSDFDTQCTECTQCDYGFYESTECSGTQDRVCSACTVCGDMEYEQSECIAGTDTVCGSCEVCKWTSDAMELERALTCPCGFFVSQERA